VHFKQYQGKSGPRRPTVRVILFKARFFSFYRAACNADAV